MTIRYLLAIAAIALPGAALAQAPNSALTLQLQANQAAVQAAQQRLQDDNRQLLADTGGNGAGLASDQANLSLDQGALANAQLATQGLLSRINQPPPVAPAAGR